MDKQQSLTFYLEIIEGKMEESTKEKVKEFLGILEIEFPELFVLFEYKVLKLYDIIKQAV